MGGPAEGVDLDAKHWLGDQTEFITAYEALVEDLAPGLLARLVIERTRSGDRLCAGSERCGCRVVSSSASHCETERLTAAGVREAKLRRANVAYRSWPIRWDAAW